MTDTLKHRGPDDYGSWLDLEAGIALGHRRLSIVDLSLRGHQPMLSPSGRYVMVFNGEIYNFLELRRELQSELPNLKFRGGSDTEVFLVAVEQWGVLPAVQRFIGMFAFALWDRQERTLYLGRDRLGEKPLYYGWMGNTFLFGSELKALTRFPGWHGEIDCNALALQMRHNYIPAPYSIYKGIRKLLPATILCIPSGETGILPEPQAYWSARESVEAGVSDITLRSTEQEMIDQLEVYLKDAVKRQMIADVPLGAFLSGGVDSSMIVALMQAQSWQPVKTFTIGFTEKDYDEAPYAKAIARHLGTDHTEVYVTPKDAMRVIEKLPVLYDEPFSDSSQIPTFLLASAARQHVTVSLSGDAGDELFAGYTHYRQTIRVLNQIRKIPHSLQVFSKRILLSQPEIVWKILSTMGSRVSGGEARNPADRLHDLLELLPIECPQYLYRAIISHWRNPTDLILGANEPSTVLTDSRQWANVGDFTRQMMYLDLLSYLPDDILVKVDRATMGVGLEARVPLLDHRVVEFANGLPVSMKFRNGTSKWLLRQVLYRHVPPALIERPKMGFGIPIGQWLRRDLRDWAEDLLDAQRMKAESIFNVKLVQQKWQQHLSGARDWRYHLWDVIVFQAWKREWQG